MDILLVCLIAFPVVGGLLSALAGGSRRRHLLPAFAPLVSSLACLGFMGAIVYRRFYMPLGASQLRISWGDWFSAPPLVANFSLRMDTVSGVIVGLTVIVGAAFQIRSAIRKADTRIRAAQSLILAAALLFVLADNLIPMLAALVATGPLLVVATRERPGGAPGSGDKALQILVIHGLGDVLALVGLFSIFGATGTMSFLHMSAPAAAMPASRLEAEIGLMLLLVGVSLRSGPGRLNALLPFAAALYLGYRLQTLAVTLPTWILGAAAILGGGWAIANLAFTQQNPPRAQARLYLLSNHFHRAARGFFADYLEGFIFRKLLPGLLSCPARLGRRLSSSASGPRGAALLATIFALSAGLVFWLL